MTANVRRSLALSFLEKYISMAVQFASGLAVARLITPEAFGVFSIAFSIVGFAHVIREMGVNAYLVQLPELRPQHVRASLFATGAVAWLLGIALFALLPVIEHLYGLDVRRATTVLLANFLIMPISSTIFATLQREMKFGALLQINVVGVVVNSALAVGLGFLGFGYMALAWASVAGQMTMVVLAVAYRPHPEHFLPSYVGVGDVFRFGSTVMLSSLLQQFSGNAANLVTARFVSLTAMGLFSRALSVTGLFSRLIMEAVQPLVLPTLATLRRGGHDLAPACLRSLDFLAVFTWPFFLFVALYARPIVVVLFGKQWVESARLLELMSLGGPLWIVQPIAVPLLTALGRVSLNLRAQAINQTVAVVGVLIGALNGIEAVAAAGVVISAVHCVVWMHYLRTVVTLRMTELARGAMRSGFVTLIALIGPLALSTLDMRLDPLSRLLLGGGGLGAGWLAGVFLARHPVAEELILFVDWVRPAAGTRSH